MLAAANLGAAQDTPPIERSVRSATATAITTPITIDGMLDEEPWRSAPKIGDLVQRQPNAGSAPTEDTEVTLLYDRDNLYIGVVAYDSEPAKVIGTQMARDAAVNADDRIEILLDTFRDQRSAFYFATNPSGALVDGLVDQQSVERRVGRDLGRADPPNEPGVGRRVRDSLQEPELSRRADGLGIQHLPQHLPEARGQPLVGRAPADAVSAGVGGGRDHQSRRADAGRRLGRPAVPRGPLAAPRRHPGR